MNTLSQPLTPRKRKRLYLWVLLWAITFSFTNLSHQYKHIVSGDDHCEFCVSGSLNAPPIHADTSFIYPIKQHFWANTYPVIVPNFFQTRPVSNRGPPASVV